MKKTWVFGLVAVLAASLVFIPTIGFAGRESDKRGTPAIPRLTREDLDRWRKSFNVGKAGRRVIVFFSSGCASCDTGSAALQAMLEKVEGPITVLAVWEPIFGSDPAPTPDMLDNLKDRRVLQVWDPDHIMSDEMRAAEKAHPGSPSQDRTRTNSKSSGIMYDTVVLFGPGARWESTLPAPEWLEVGLEAVLPELRKRLAAPRPLDGKSGGRP